MSEQIMNESIAGSNQIKPGDETIAKSNDGKVGKRKKAARQSSEHEVIARILEHSEIKRFVSNAPNQPIAKIKTIRILPGSLQVVFEVPLPQVAQSVGLDECIATRYEQRWILMEFVWDLLKRIDSQLPNHTYSQFVRFLIKTRIPEEYGPQVLKYLERIPQRKLAGRPAKQMPEEAKALVQSEHEVIQKTVTQFHDEIVQMKASNSKLTKEEVTKFLEETYPADKYPWSRYFLENSNNLPRPRYVRGMNSPSMRGQIPSSDLAHPENWDLTKIVVQILQRIVSGTGHEVNLREIRAVYKSKETSEKELPANS